MTESSDKPPAGKPADETASGPSPRTPSTPGSGDAGSGQRPDRAPGPERRGRGRGRDRNRNRQRDRGRDQERQRGRDGGRDSGREGDSEGRSSRSPDRGRERGESRPRRSRNKAYVYPTPIRSDLREGLWTELRRFTAGDVFARQQRMRGKEILFRAGFTSWDRQVLLEALRANESISEIEERARKLLGDALSSLAITGSIDADDSGSAGDSADGLPVVDSSPQYFRWTQWIFLELLRRDVVTFSQPGQLGQLEGPRPLDDTEFEDSVLTGKNGQVERDRLWMLRLQPYGDRLMNDLGKSNWSPEEKINQRHRLGRRRGCELAVQVGQPLRMEVDELRVFTTRVEAIYGTTFVLVHPWHPILDAVVDPTYVEDVLFYRDRVLRNQEPRLSAARTGGYAINPANFQRVPILVSRLAMEPDTGGVILGIPAHDPTLFELAQRVRLPIREVIRGEGSRYDVRGRLVEAYTGDGNLTGSGIYNGVPTRSARDRILSSLGRRGICRRTTRFFFDWLPISDRSAYGVPVPVVHCDACGPVPLSEENLPVLPPRLSLSRIRGAAEGDDLEAAIPRDLSFSRQFVTTTCPQCGAGAKRDTQVIAAWLHTAWMHLRLPVPELATGVEGMGSAAAESQGVDDDSSDPGESLEESATPRSYTIDDIDELALFEDRDAGEGAEIAGAASAEEAQAGGPQESGDAPGDAAAEDAQPPVAAAPAPPDARAARSEALQTGADSADEGASHVDGVDGSDGPAVADSEAGSAAGGDDSVAQAPQESGPSAPGEPDASESKSAPESSGITSSGEIISRPTSPRRLQPFRHPEIRKWLSVDLALGRPGEGVLDILRTRFLTKFFYDVREVSFYEPYYRYSRVARVRVRESGDGEKDVERSGDADSAELRALSWIETYSDDAVRWTLLSRRRLYRPLVVSEADVHHAHRFLGRLRRHLAERVDHGKFVSRRLLVHKHRLIHTVTESIRRMRLNRAITAFHELFKSLHSAELTLEEMDRKSIQTVAVVLWPLAPRTAVQIWAKAGGEGELASQPWPEASEELLNTVEVEIPVFVRNRLAQRLVVERGLDSDALRTLALDDERVREALASDAVDRVVVVPDRIVSIVVESSTGPRAEKPSDAGAGEDSSGDST